MSTGPSNFWGLPGLILEVKNGDEIMMCNKIVLNPEDKISLKEPTRGKTVTQKVYNEILINKLKDIQNRYAPGRGKDKNQSIEIRIGG